MKVVDFPITTAETVLKAALEEKLSHVYVIGYDTYGEIYVAGSNDGIFEAMERAKYFLVSDE